jgi:hypothetical protein
MPNLPWRLLARAPTWCGRDTAPRSLASRGHRATSPPRLTLSPRGRHQGGAACRTARRRFCRRGIGTLRTPFGRSHLAGRSAVRTLNYAAQTPLAAVNVALLSGGRVAAAACADPFAGEVFWTDGDQAFMRRDGQDDRLRPSSRSRLVDLNLDPPHPNGDRFMAVRLLSIAELTNSFRPRVLSTTLALAWVATGHRAAYVTDGRVQDSVHFASGIALCQAAGCRVTGLRGQPLSAGASERPGRRSGQRDARDPRRHHCRALLGPGVDRSSSTSVRRR